MEWTLQRIEQRLDRIEAARGAGHTPPTEQLVYRSDWADSDGARADGAGQKAGAR